MGTLSDYIKWRGDLEFWQDGFNVIDNMILSCLSYVPLDGIYEKYGAEVIDIQDVNEIYFKNFHDENRYGEGSILRDGPITLSEVKNSGLRGLQAMTKTAGNLSKKFTKTVLSEN